MYDLPGWPRFFVQEHQQENCCMNEIVPVQTNAPSFLSRLRSKCETIGVTISGDGGGGVNI